MKFTVSSAASTKSRELVYLLGKYVEEIRGLKLPSNRQALGHFLFLHREQRMTVHEASTQWRKLKISRAEPEF